MSYISLLLAAAMWGAGGGQFIDVTDAVGLGTETVPETVSRLCFADLNGDGWPDVVIDRHRVFLNQPDEASPIGRRFAEVSPERTGLREPVRGTLTVFADLDNDGNLDAIVAEYINKFDENWEDHGRRTAWQKGNGDGTFGPPQVIEEAPEATTCAIAVGDVNHDALPDLWIGNWYIQYGGSYAGYHNHLLLQTKSGWQVRQLPADSEPSVEPPSEEEFDEATDALGRPTYGVMIAELWGTPLLGTNPNPQSPELIELNYGRRWNRCYDLMHQGLAPRDYAPQYGLDGDAIRHGEYPDWAVQRMAQRDPPIELEPEKPFRANGNTFDCSVGDINNDGDFDLFLAEITHGWAGDSSDRSRFLINSRDDRWSLQFVYDPRLCVDRIPPDQENWNQGDLFCELADLDHDTRLDLILSSGDYPDNQRLRIYLQQPDGTFADSTEALRIDHDGSQQISLDDVDGDGDLDILVGQTFFRYTAEMKEGRTPQPRLFINNATQGRQSLVLRLKGDGKEVSRDALGTIVRAKLADGTVMSRQVIGVGGHAGKQNGLIIHFGLGDAEVVDELTVEWPDAEHSVQELRDVVAGRYSLKYGGELAAVGGAKRQADLGMVSDQGYIGLALRDIPSGHTVVSWIFPGPLQGQGIASPDMDLSRPDLIVAVDGQAMNADQFREYIRAAGPGAKVKIEYRRSSQRGGTIPDDLNHEEEVRTIEVVLESLDEWQGTIKRPRGHDTAATFDGPMMLDPFDPENVLGKAVAENELTEPLRTLMDVFVEWQDNSSDYHSLSRVRAAFDNPFCLPELEQLVTAPTHDAPADPFGTALRLMKENLDTPGPQPFSAADWNNDGRTALETLVFEGLYHLTLQMRRALGDLYGGEAFARKCLDFLRVPRRTFYLAGDETKDHVEVIRRSMDVDFGHLEPAVTVFGQLTEGLPAAFEDLTPIDPPDELVGAVEGDILLASHDDLLGWIVIGSRAANRYDMAKIAAVVDPGGNDEYYATDLRLGCRVIIDYSGDDTYTGTADQGPAAALLGASFIDDRAGNDQYEGALLSTGAAMYGVSLLLDRAGHDTYIGSEWSIGAACYGAAMIFDLGGGSDKYLGDFLCEGVGGPRGFGCIIDDNGRDLYRANGPTSSAYGTPAVYQSFSQGMAFGYRQYASGGVGLISDLGGDDRYEAGEFAQGGAYYWGLGVLHDANGRDLYYGNRYGQGFGVHQAAGILADEAGDDTYWSMTAASQGAAWDIGVGLLIDRAGNDTYQCDGLGQGGASQQAIALFVDMAGVDRYVAGGGATQGQSGGNAYHFHDTGAFSFSLLLDLGGGADHYSRGRANDSTTLTGKYNEANAKNSGLHGVVIDQ
ncbi:MAG: VCBS repeat-containing protein [Phycisphaerales bacterium]|nr:MAG: VCBS repeat-containing protein [Phycisphaerales bacterium]